MGQLSYSVVLEWHEAQHQVTATVPAFPLSTYGADKEDALEKIRGAILVTSRLLKNPAWAHSPERTG